MPDHSSLELHAAIWRKAARVIAEMDAISAFNNSIMQSMQGSSMSTISYPWPFSKEDEAAARAYGRAATVLRKIADEYEAAAKAETKEPA